MSDYLKIVAGPAVAVAVAALAFRALMAGLRDAGDRAVA
jgi:ABC-type dipeptide/oligopeptide/nickel transport system permease subunit